MAPLDKLVRVRETFRITPNETEKKKCQSRAGFFHFCFFGFFYKHYRSHPPSQPPSLPSSLLSSLPTLLFTFLVTGMVF